MKQIIIAFLTLMAVTAVRAQVPAFPGAEGHGRYVTGGRGGEVIHVTNLNNSGAGSLRAAVSGSNKKIIVFDVGGVIPLSSDLSIGDNTTIAGQTAPYPGITLRYYTVRPGNNNIIRFIRIRRGEEKDLNDGADAIWNREKSSIILDHCSFSWSIDEVASFYDNNNFTMQWCTIAESLVDAGHGKGAHGYGGIWGGKLASFHHNLIAHVANRSPRFCGARYVSNIYQSNTEYSTYQWANPVQAENVDFRNCVIYNCGNGCYGGPGGGQINMVNNYYKSGPAGATSRITQVSVANEGNSKDKPDYWTMTSRYYINGNRLNNTSNADWGYVIYDSGVYTSNNEKYSADPGNYYGSGVEHKTISGVSCVRIKMDSPAPTGEVTTHTAVKAFDKVLAHAGASLDRDNVDARYMTEAQNGTATYTGSVSGKQGRIDRVSDVNGYTEANFGTGSRDSNYDTDRDGISDEWETANGLNPNDASDAKTYTIDPEGWYCNLEVFLNSIVEDIMKEENEDATEAVEDYYPPYTKVVKEDPTQDEVTYTIAQSTYLNSPADAEWAFAEGITVTNNNSKKYGAGYEDGIKYSAGVKHTISLPEGFNLTKVTITGYDNYSEADAYLSELNGTTYSSTQYVFPKKTSSGTYTVQSYNITFPEAVTGSFTITPAGKQVVWVLALTGYYEQEEDTGEPAEYTISDATHTSDPAKAQWGFQNGITVTNKNDKGYTTGFENGIKYSAGVQYTIQLPDDFHVEKATFAGYDNYDGSDSYINECNGVNYPSTTYVYPKKDSSGNYTWTSHEITFDTPVDGSLTFTAAGKQVVWVITLSGKVGGSVTPPPTKLPGDANDDGVVSISDVTAVVDCVLGNPPAGFNFTNADVNEDGKMDVTDITLIVDIILKN